MEDTNYDRSPLISNSDYIVENQSLLEETIEQHIGIFNWRQLLQILLVSLVWTFDSQQSFISIFTDGQPTWHCVAPLDLCNQNSNICLLPKNSWSWDLPSNTSIVSEWSLNCASSIISGLPASSFYLGCVVGGFALVGLGDSSFGRKKTMLLSCLLMSVGGLLAAVSTNVWMYSAFRFISGIGRATIGNCSLVLASEFVGKRWSSRSATIGFFFFTLGFLSLPAIAYLNRGSSWRVMYLLTCTPAIFYCLLVYLFFHDSPRWLFLQGRTEEFVRTINSISSSNNGHKLTLASISHMTSNQKSESGSIYSAIQMIFERKWAIHRLMASMVLAFGVGLVYYGIPLGVGNLNFNIYLSTGFNALLKFPANFVSYFIIGNVKRRTAILTFTTLCGISCLTFAFTTSGEVQTVTELMSFFSICNTFGLLIIYTLELFPTCIKSSALTIVRQVIMSGGVTSPLLLAIAKREDNNFLSYLVFGLTIGICGLSVIWLPETKGETPCDTMEEEERKQSRKDATTLLYNCQLINMINNLLHILVTISHVSHKEPL